MEGYTCLCKGVKLFQKPPAFQQRLVRGRVHLPYSPVPKRMNLTDLMVLNTSVSTNLMMVMDSCLCISLKPSYYRDFLMAVSAFDGVAQSYKKEMKKKTNRTSTLSQEPLPAHCILDKKGPPKHLGVNRRHFVVTVFNTKVFRASFVVTRKTDPASPISESEVYLVDSLVLSLVSMP